MTANPKIEIRGMAGGRWIRLQAEAVEDDRREARQHMLDIYPSLQGMYSADDGNCRVFYLKNAVAAICSFGGELEIIRFFRNNQAGRPFAQIARGTPCFAFWTRLNPLILRRKNRKAVGALLLLRTS